MSSNDAEYEVYALRYASWLDRKKSELYFRHDLYKVPDDYFQLDCFFWLIRNSDRTILVDCGYDRERGEAKGRLQDADPVDLLASLGVTPADVDHVILSHMHYDHIGNVGLFENATFSMAGAELDFWTGPYGGRTAIAFAAEPWEVQQLTRLRDEGRLTLFEDGEVTAPGIVVTRVGGHTPGQSIVEVSSPNGTVLLACDAVHFYDELDFDRPFYNFADIREMYGAYDTLREMDRDPKTYMVAGHDPAVMTRFATIAPNCVDLTRPVELPARPRSRKSPGSESLPPVARPHHCATSHDHGESILLEARA
ncbi:Glyoxylase, beta-lactamase superfamily II [Microbacterium sp. cf046]|uniref:N-acyl homoserine lactonase family protein n=1 Tax=Microbacterium sp. cf046 TaxID=1761803 RepID=UPI0008E403D0|nr:N-acyl homoserine lactonase family protein [Microbacterium sp. cf046]SFS16757.1 Glyoxylase, beta-lactamase superfamily II [Microbacterium sp. cf046]